MRVEGKRGEERSRKEKKREEIKRKKKREIELWEEQKKMGREKGIKERREKIVEEIRVERGEKWRKRRDRRERREEDKESKGGVTLHTICWTDWKRRIIIIEDDSFCSESTSDQWGLNPICHLTQYLWHVRSAGKALFIAPRGRSFEDFKAESLSHGWPSFRDEEVRSIINLRRNNYVVVIFSN